MLNVVKVLRRLDEQKVRLTTLGENWNFKSNYISTNLPQLRCSFVVIGLVGKPQSSTKYISFLLNGCLKPLFVTHTVIGALALDITYLTNGKLCHCSLRRFAFVRYKFIFQALTTSRDGLPIENFSCSCFFYFRAILFIKYNYN